jgi:hypothetical protein
LFGLIVCFAGYRFFIMLLPVWGFFTGFALGAQAINALFGTGFLAELTSWIVGFVVAVVFAVLSYLFYIIGVALLAGSVGYALGSGIVFAISENWNILAFLIGLAVAIIVAAVVILLNIQKYAVILLTALGGAGAIITAFLLLFNQIDVTAVGQNGVIDFLSENLIWMVIGLILVGLGFAAQLQTTRSFSFEPPPDRVNF